MRNPGGKDISNRATEVSKALRRRFSLFAGVGVFSGVINLLALTGSMYMLQVYDRVIPSRSLPTLVGLTALMLGLYLANGLLDMLRARVMTRIGLKFDKDLRSKIFEIVLLIPLRVRQGGDGLLPIRDLDQIRGFMATPGPVALFDMPWLPFFIFIIYMLHPWLGILAILGGLLLMTMAITTEFMSRKPVREAASSAATRHVFGDAARRNAEVIRAMGMGGRIQSRWMEQSAKHLMDQRGASDVVGGFGAMSKIFRMILQSAMLGLGAYLVILGEATPGVMIAGSILLSRALSPIEIAIANWRGFIAARQSYQRLKNLFATFPQTQEVMPLPPPSQSLTVQGVWVGAPGDSAPIVQNVSFGLKAGAGLGIIGLSASGKSTLARALVGVWEPMPQRGSVRLDGASLDQWSPDQLGRHIGYLPQDIELFDGSIAENIARFDPEMTSDSIIAAAQSAGVHEMILHLSNGYDTRIGDGGVALSAGQRQRVGLARALYGDPFLVVLDEPNSNLDAHGDSALAGAILEIRGRGGIVIVIAHRPSVLAGLDELLAMANGQLKAFGPKDEVLAKVTGQAPAPQLAKPPAGNATRSPATNSPATGSPKGTPEKSNPGVQAAAPENSRAVQGTPEQNLRPSQGQQVQSQQVQSQPIKNQPVQGLQPHNLAFQNPATQNPATQNPATQNPATQNPAPQKPAPQKPAPQREASPKSPSGNSEAVQAQPQNSPAQPSMEFWTSSGTAPRRPPENFAGPENLVRNDPAARKNTSKNE